MRLAERASAPVGTLAVRATPERSMSLSMSARGNPETRASRYYGCMTVQGATCPRIFVKGAPWRSCRSAFCMWGRGGASACGRIGRRARGGALVHAPVQEANPKFDGCHCARPIALRSLFLKFTGECAWHTQSKEPRLRGSSFADRDIICATVRSTGLSLVPNF